MATEKPRKAREEGCGKRGGRRAKAKKAGKGALKRRANTNLGGSLGRQKGALKRSANTNLRASRGAAKQPGSLRRLRRAAAAKRGALKR